MLNGAGSVKDGKFNDKDIGELNFLFETHILYKLEYKIKWILLLRSADRARGLIKSCHYGEKSVSVLQMHCYRLLRLR